MKFLEGQLKTSLLFSSLLILFYSIILAQRPLEDKAYLKNFIYQYETILLKNPKDIQTLKTLGILYHNLSLLGEKPASENAVKYLTKANELTGESDAEIIAYLGSSFTLKGRDAALPTMKIYYVKKGCDLIDKAVNKQPKNIVARMVRINNSLSLPTFFDRLKYAEKDCLFLIKCYEKKEIEIDKETLVEIYFRLGEVYYKKDKLDKAEKLWQETIEICPESSFALRAKQKIAQLKHNE